MHHAILRHQQQLANLQRQMNALTDRNGRYIQLLDILVQHKEAIEKGMNQHVQTMTLGQVNQQIAQQLLEIDSRLSLLDHDLRSIDQQLSEQMEKQAEAAAEWSKQHSELERDVSSLSKQSSALVRNIFSLSKRISEIEEDISSLKVQFGVLQDRLAENARRWDENLKSALEDVQQTYNARLSEIQQKFQSSLKELNDQYENRMTDFSTKLLALDIQMGDIRWQLEESNARFQQQWAASEAKRKRSTLIFCSVLSLFAIWEVYQYFLL